MATQATAPTRILTGLEQIEVLSRPRTRGSGPGLGTPWELEERQRADRATRSWASCLAVRSHAQDLEPPRAFPSATFSGLKSSSCSSGAHDSKITNSAPLFWHPLLACRFTHAAHSSRRSPLFQTTRLFFAEHGQRIHELHMARSTLVQLDSIDRVSPQRLRCTTGFRAAPTLISMWCAQWFGSSSVSQCWAVRCQR